MEIVAVESRDVAAGTLVRDVLSNISEARQHLSQSYAHAVVFDKEVTVGQQAESLVRLLVDFNMQNPDAQSLLICERKSLHGGLHSSGPDVVFGTVASGSAEENALKRVHVKYVAPMSGNDGRDSVVGGSVPLTTLLISLQCLPFVPDIVAVLRLTDIAAVDVADSTVQLPSSFGQNVTKAPWYGSSFAALADTQQFALATGLFVDAVAQWSTLKDAELSVKPPVALLWDDAERLDEARRALVGCTFDVVQRGCLRHQALQSSDGEVPSNALVALPLFGDATASTLQEDTHMVPLPEPLWGCM